MSTSSSAMLVSFIIPSYNSAHTVRRCLDSIYALSLKQEEYEVIFIDDCSKDNTCELVKEYQKQHTNLTLLRQSKNNRQGAARNRGVSVAKGEYICFVDSDDAVTEGIVEAIRLAKEKQTDMTAYHTAYANEEGQITKENDRLSFPQGQLYSGIELQNQHPYWFSGPVAYVYNRAFLDKTNYPFREEVLYEDSDFVMVHLYYAQRMVYSPKLGYLAYYREGSTTHSTSYKNVSDYLLLGTRMLALYGRMMNEQSTNERVSDAARKFTESVLEGACYNVMISCKNLLKLHSIKDVNAFYERVDERVSRSELSENIILRKYYWNHWTWLCMKNMTITKLVIVLLIPMYKLFKQ